MLISSLFNNSMYLFFIALKVSSSKTIFAFFKCFKQSPEEFEILKTSIARSNNFLIFKLFVILSLISSFTLLLFKLLTLLLSTLLSSIVLL